jgi:multiple sugar transport system permease protein
MYPPQWIPEPIVWENYATAMRVMNFPVLLKNTVLVTSLSMVGAMATSALAAYSFARLRFPARDFIFIVVLATMMLPSWVTLIPVYIIFRELGLINTLWPLIIPSFFGGGAFNIFLLRQFFMTLPFELDDAAKIDGCSNFRTFWNILLPLTKPALGAIAVFQFVGHWNDFFGPLVYLHSAEKMTLAVGLYRFKGPFSVEWNYLMAATVMVAIAPIVVYFLAQRYFIEGVVMSGMKA